VPLVLDPEAVSEGTLRELLASLRQDLEEVEESVRHPRGRVIDPASLETAADLVASAKALLARPSTDDRETIAAQANLAYAVLLAAIDLVKSHTDTPKVPPPRPVRPPTKP
jgi:hypothetical protein